MFPDRPGLTLLDGRVHVDDEVHLPLILVRQEDEAHDALRVDLVVEGLAVKVDVGGVDLEVEGGINKAGRLLAHIWQFIIFTLISYLPLGERQCTSLKMAMASPEVVTTLAFFMTFSLKASTGSSPASSEVGMWKRISVNITAGSSF